MPNPCMLCSASCCKDLYITVTAFDVIRIAKETGRKPEEFAELYPLRLLIFDNDTVLEVYDGKYPNEKLLCLKSHPCIFLESNKCTIHRFSPSVCRSFPKGTDGRYRTRLCPFPAGLAFRVMGTDSRETYAWELEMYKKIVEQWNGRRGKKTDCMGFLLDRAKESLSYHPGFDSAGGSGRFPEISTTSSSEMK